MPNFQLPKGQYTIIGITLFQYDTDGGGQLVPDTTTQVNFSAAPQLLVEPVAPGPTNREFYVSVQPGQVASTVNCSVVLQASIPATGAGVGAANKFTSQTFTIDTVVPVDHRGSQPSGPSAVQPLPHP